MIAIDTNILVRYLVQDDRRQAKRATEFIERELSAERPGFVSLPVVCELSWVLRSSYGLDRNRIVEVIAALMETVQLEFDEADVLTAALAEGEGEVADAIIHRLGLARGCEGTVTLDRQFARLAGVDLLESR